MFGEFKTTIWNRIVEKFKENPETYPREEFYNDLQSVLR